MESITSILERVRHGGPGAREDLINAVYPELHRIARCAMNKEHAPLTLQPTALINEAWLRLFQGKPIKPVDRVHFFALAAGVMRRVLVDHARKKKALRRGGDQALVSLMDIDLPGKGMNIDCLALQEALDRLKRIAPRRAQVIELRFFGGLQLDEVAAILDLAPITVRKDLKIGATWLRNALSKR